MGAFGFDGGSIGESGEPSSFQLVKLENLN